MIDIKKVCWFVLVQQENDILADALGIANLEENVFITISDIADEGLLITISSHLARLHLPYVGAFTATKAAIDVIATTYHFELSRLDIDSIIIQPGAILTELWHKSCAPEGLSAVPSYGEHGAQIKEGIEKVFIKTPESPDPQIVVDVIARVINTPQGQRDMWNVIGMGGLEQTVKAINNSTGEFSKGVQTSLGIAIG